MSDTILRLPEVKARTGLAKSTVFLYVKQGIFPRPIELGPNAIGWVESEIQDWIDARKAKRAAKVSKIYP
jgi:prophage regulatory protein